MGSVMWTPEQRDAIYTRGCDILVAAGAGAGKTAVLVERVIQGLLSETDSLDMERLLVVTFTEAAAAEMRQRIRDALENKLGQEPENRRLQQQLERLPLASISTIHAFCSRMLRQYFYHLGLDPGFRIMTEPEANLLRYETIDAVLADYYVQAHSEMLGFFDAYGGNDGDGIVRELILRLYAFQMSLPEPEAWQKAVLEAYSPDSTEKLHHLPLMQEAQLQVMLELGQVLSMLEQALALCYLPSGPESYADRLEREIGAVRDLRQMTGNRQREDIRDWVAPFDRLPAIKKTMGVDDELKSRCQVLRNAAKDKLNKLMTTFFARRDEEIIQELEHQKPILEMIFELVNQFGATYGKTKAKQGILDFADLEQLALKLLTVPRIGGGLGPSSVALDLQEQFDEVLIDEYQDTNGVQDCILAMIAGAHGESPGCTPRFMVGDIKQSIYGFRLTEPRLFLDKYARFSPGRGAEQRRIDLATNFRCRQEIIHGVNYIFRQLMDAGIAGMDYDEEAELKHGAFYPEPGAEMGELAEVAAAGEIPTDTLPLEGTQQQTRLEVYLLESKADAGPAGDQGESYGAEQIDGVPGVPDAEPDELERLEREAWLIACRIRQLVGGSQDGGAEQVSRGSSVVWDKSLKMYRPIEHRDIVVLLRSVKNRANQVMEVFRQAGIPAYADLGTGYFGAIEIKLMISLLQVLDNPQQDIPLAAVLRAPWVALSPEELVSLRLAAPRASFHGAVMAAAEEQNSLGERLRGVLLSLDTWRTAARRLPLGQLICYLYRETGFYDYAGSMPKGEQRQANLRGLHDRAREFDEFAGQGLSRFVGFLERLQADDDLGEVKPLGEGENVVRVMSMHKSKGLEFPVVFLADLGKGFNLRDQEQDILLHKELGPGLKIIDPEQRIKCGSLSHHVVKGRMHRDALAEEMRILYVAMTRAREMLILVGSQGPLDGICARWANAARVDGWPLPDDILVSAKNCLDWLGPALARHRDGSLVLAVGGMEPDSLQDRAVASDASRWSIWLEGQSEPLSWFQVETQRQEQNTIAWDRIEELQSVYPEVLSEERAVAFSRQLLWQYPGQALVNLPAKISVTELKSWVQMATEANEVGGGPGVVATMADGVDVLGSKGTRHVARRPRSILAEKERFGAVEKGVWTHTLLQCLDLTKDLGNGEILRDEAQRLVERRFLTAEQVAAIDLGSIEWFFQSTLGRRLLASPSTVWRELPFTMALPVEAVYGVSQRHEQVVIQGVIDCLVEEPEGLLLIDFKTDRVTRDSAPIVAANYGVQLEQYRQAVAAIFGQQVREAYLYFLQGQIAVPMPWQDAGSV